MLQFSQMFVKALALVVKKFELILTASNKDLRLKLLEAHNGQSGSDIVELQVIISTLHLEGPELHYFSINCFLSLFLF